jgi:hypothetical protein
MNRTACYYYSRLFFFLLVRYYVIARDGWLNIKTNISKDKFIRNISSKYKQIDLRRFDFIMCNSKYINIKKTVWFLVKINPDWSYKNINRRVVANNACQIFSEKYHLLYIGIINDLCNVRGKGCGLPGKWFHSPDNRDCWV